MADLISTYKQCLYLLLYFHTDKASLVNHISSHQLFHSLEMFMHDSFPYLLVHEGINFELTQIFMRRPKKIT